MSRQPRLFEFRMGERSPDTLVVAAANRDAARLLTDWRAWPGGTLALVGPTGSGKTHLAMAWAVEAGAGHLAPDAGPDAAAAAFREFGGRLYLDDADARSNEAALWRVLDLSRVERGAVLLVGATPPATWPASLPDLRSRLAAMPVARLGEPDEALMEVILRRICREQFIQLSDDAVRYLLPRLPRTFAAARRWAQALDADLAHASRPVSLLAAKKALMRVQAQREREEG